MTTAPATGTVERELLINARPEIVFRLLTDPAEMLRWQGVEVELDPLPGGIYRCQLNALGHTTLGRFIEVTPYSRIVFSWGWQAGPFDIPPGSTTVEIRLAPEGAATRLHLLHRELPTVPAITESHGVGWVHYLDRLAIVAAGGDPGADDWADGNMGEPPA